MKAIISFVVVSGSLASLTGALAAGTTDTNGRPPLVLDSETGVHGGNGGTVLESAPLPGEAHRAGATIRPGQASGGTVYLVEPTVLYGAGSAGYVQPGTAVPSQPGSQPGSQPLPRPSPEPGPPRDPGSGQRYGPHGVLPANGTRGDIVTPGSQGDVPVPRPRRDLRSGSLPHLPRVPTPGTH
jgi:hypothetical protein